MTIYNSVSRQCKLCFNYFFAIVCLIVSSYPQISDARPSFSQDNQNALEVSPEKDFYAQDPSLSLPSDPAPGEVLRYQLIDRSKAKNQAKEHLLYRLLYVSTMRHVIDGKNKEIPFITSGVIAFPKDNDDNKNIKTGLQTLVYTHGTLGVNPQCGLSRYAETMRVDDWMLDSNLKTATPDYPGLGYESDLWKNSDYSMELSALTLTSQRPWRLCYAGTKPFANSAHPYVSVQAEGRSAIDIVRAANKLEQILENSNTPQNNEFAVVGASQGGHAALAVGELMHAPNSYAPELKLKSIVAGAPASELIIDTGSKNLAMVLVGYSLEFLDFTPSKYMSDRGMCDYFYHIDNLCVGWGTGGVNWGILNTNPFKYNYDDLKNKLYGNPGDPNEPGDPAFLAAVEANTLGNRPIDVPVMIGQSVKDPTIPVDMTNRLVDRLESDDEKPATKVTYCKYGKIGDGPKDNHNEILSIMFDAKKEECINATDFLTTYELQIKDKQ